MAAATAAAGLAVCRQASGSSGWAACWPVKPQKVITGLPSTR
ncbi:hypothetical protein ACFSHR_15880 [Azotobacter chroococcum]